MTKTPTTTIPLGASQPAPNWQELANRTDRFRPDADDLERLMVLNDILAASPLPTALCDPRLTGVPLIFVIGTTRSGTTIMLQTLANCFEVTYPDNIAARFWGALHYGISVSRSIQHQCGLGWPRPLDNDIGITDDPMGVHAVGYFWRRFIEFEDGQYFGSDDEKRSVDTERLTDELTAMYRVGGERPLLFRGMYTAMVCDFMAEILPGAFFIDMRRDLVDVALSALAVRKRRYGDETAWWGMEPPEHKVLRDHDPETQVTGQMYHLRRRVDEALTRIPEARRISVAIADFRRAPGEVLDRIREKASAGGVSLARRQGVAYPSPFDAGASLSSAGSGRRGRIETLLRALESDPDYLASDQND